MSVVDSRLEEAPPRPDAALGSSKHQDPSRRWLWLAGLAALVVLGVVHTLVVARRYHVGSFDDDASYILSARALASGAGLTTKLATGLPLVGVYPPGYPAVLAPLVLIWGHATLPLRALSVVLFVAIFPLTWVYLGRRGISKPVRLVVLLLLAMSPVLATYGSMIMAEVPFVVVFLLFLLAAARWQEDRGVLTWAGAGTVVAAASLLWLKEAGIGLILGLVAWLLLRRLWHKALVAAIAPAVLFLPVVLARAVAGVSLIGSRYSSDLGSYDAGGLVHRFTHTVPHAVSTYISHALPLSVVPTRASPLPLEGVTGALLAVAQWTVAPLILVGFVVWVRRHRDAACVVVPVYLAETLLYPYVNERRVILVLPVIVAWYVLGAQLVLGGAVRLIQRATPRARAASMALPTAFGLLVLVPLVLQFPRDYLYALHQDSPQPGGSSYMTFLRELGRPEEVVETDYLWTTALYSGHRTAAGIFAIPPLCDLGLITKGVNQDNAGYVLSAALNKPGLVDDPCLLPVIAPQPWAVRLYRTGRDDASVFELIGPGTGHPLLRDLTVDAQLNTSATTVVEVPEAPQADADPAGSYPTVETTDGEATLTWSWSQPSQISQVSLGAAAPTSGSLTSVVIEARTAAGIWQTISAVAGPVGDGSARPYVLVHLAQPLTTTAVRVTVTGQGTIGIHDLHVLGQA
ncbi:MAG TPA: hypothetical protein VLL25_01180 [Acidimicrobiales bacterium]|nr:hypothetical protein [Acidimicrobiales bacterium]